MNIEKLKQMEPLFGSWYVETKISEGKNSKFYKVYRANGIQKDFLGLKTVKFPSSDKELSRVIASGKYNNIDEYLDVLQQRVSKNMSIMQSLSNHKNIVKLQAFTIIREASCFYLMMLVELLNPLNSYLSFENVSKADVLKLGKDMCLAMEAFRENGIIHHNITPENIYVDSMGNYKLGDFGVFDYDNNISEGSLYIAPELYHKNHFGDTSSDIYSLGILLYKLMNNNRLPFLPPRPAPISLSDRETSFAKCMRGETFPAPVNADFKLTNIILKATSFNANNRYTSPLTMLSQLESYTTYPKSSYVAPQPENNFETSHNDGIHFDSYEYPQEETFEDEYEETFDESEDEQPKKRWYFLVFALVIVLALVVALIVKSGSDGKDKTTTSHTSTTLAPPTQTTTQTTTESTTEETTTEETTTEETTTEETTTEETTTEETTTEETTTETTTEETSTEETTTEEPSTEETTTELFVEPTLVSTNRKNGDQSSDGKTYMKIITYNVEEIPEDEFFDQVVLSIGDNLGENLMGTKSYIYQMSGSALIQKVSADISCETSEESGGNILCTITVEDSDFYYEPENYQYYLCFEEGAIVSDTVITLPLQIRIEQKF